MNKDLLKKSQLAWGLCVICVLFLLETWNANRVQPHAATPLIWSLLGFTGTVAAGLGLWFGHRYRRSGDEQ